MRAHYEKRFGSYYLIQKCDPNPITNPDGERIVLMADRLAVAVDTSMGELILMKHGSVEQVEAWAQEARRKYLAQAQCNPSLAETARRMADGVVVVTLPQDFPCEEINHCLDNISGIGALLKKHVPELYESTVKERS